MKEKIEVKNNINVLPKENEKSWELLDDEFKKIIKKNMKKI